MTSSYLQTFLETVVVFFFKLLYYTLDSKLIFFALIVLSVLPTSTTDMSSLYKCKCNYLMNNKVLC